MSLDKRFIETTQRYWTDARLTRITGGKQLIVLPHEAPILLRTMGILAADGSMGSRAVPKYRQINHMLAVLWPELFELTQKYDRIDILDACCGNSFLSLLVAWLLADRMKVDFRLLGIDRNEAVIRASQERARSLGWQDRVRFITADVSAANWARGVESLFPDRYTLMPRPHLLIALHACDKATDDALASGLQLASDVIAVAPCCQAELARSWKEQEFRKHPLAILYQSANLRREAAATTTDAMRMLLAKACGYETHATEFVSSEHTPKNRLLICKMRQATPKPDFREYHAFRKAMGGAGIGLEGLLTNHFQPSTPSAQFHQARELTV